MEDRPLRWEGVGELGRGDLGDLGDLGDIGDRVGERVLVKVSSGLATVLRLELECEEDEEELFLGALVAWHSESSEEPSGRDLAVRKKKYFTILHRRTHQPTKYKNILLTCMAKTTNIRGFMFNNSLFK